MNLEQALQRLREEAEEIARVDAERPATPGAITPRERVAALADDGSFFEVGRLARSQQPSAEHATPADGLITGYARVHGREVAVLAEDPVVLALTDGQVARNKRNRLLLQAAQRGVPVVYLADGPDSQPRFGPESGTLFGRLSDQHPAVPLAGHPAPVVTALLGPCRGQDATLAALSDLVVAAERAASLPAAVRVPDDRAAIDAVRHFLALCAGEPAAAPEGGPPERPLTDDADVPAPAGLLGAVLDRGALFAAGSPTHAGAAGAIDGRAVVAFAAQGRLDAAGLAVYAALARTSARLRLPLVVFQDADGYDPQAAADPLFLERLAALQTTLRESATPKLALVAGRGHVLGDYALGGRRLGFDYLGAWCGARIGVEDVAHYDPLPAPAEVGPWLAAGLGLVDDVLAPSETRGRLSHLLRLIEAARHVPPPETHLRAPGLPL